MNINPINSTAFKGGKITLPTGTYPRYNSENSTIKTSRINNIGNDYIELNDGEKLFFDKKLFDKVADAYIKLKNIPTHDAEIKIDYEC